METECIKAEYSVGDYVWYCIEYQDYLLMVRCKIIEIDDHFRRQHPSGYIFYSLDEPVGHSVDADMLSPEFDEREGFSDDEGEFVPDTNHSGSLLEDWRAGMIEFICKTHEYEVSIADVRHACQLKEKTEGEDWFVFRKKQ
ncbi:MAG: hypothetical protein HYS44_03065 [Candidatus Niyogibacteria bacterium]|nr:hypothetical protein [Candidatus Niyogibacteria bacterium]